MLQIYWVHLMGLLQEYSLRHPISTSCASVCICVLSMYLCVFDEVIRRTGERLPGGGKDPTDRLKRPINTPLAHLQAPNNTLVVGIAEHSPVYYCGAGCDDYLRGVRLGGSLSTSTPHPSNQPGWEHPVMQTCTPSIRVKLVLVGT